MSAIGMSAPRGKAFAVSAYADVRHEQLFFERQQSLALRSMEWEGRIKPMTSWSMLIMRAWGVAILAFTVAGLFDIFR